MEEPWKRKIPLPHANRLYIKALHRFMEDGRQNRSNKQTGRTLHLQSHRTLQQETIAYSRELLSGHDDITLNAKEVGLFAFHPCKNTNFSCIMTCRLSRVFLRDAFRKVDGTGGTDDAAEVATDTLGADNAGLTRGAVEDDGLMAAVVA